MMMRMMLIMLILPKATIAWLEASGKGQLPRCLQLGTYTEIQQQYMYIFSKYKLYYKLCTAVQCHCKKSIHPIQYQVASIHCDKWWGEYNIRHWSWGSRVETSNFTASLLRIVLIWVELRSVQYGAIWGNFCHIMTFPHTPCRPGQIIMVQNGLYMCPAYSTTCFKFNQHLSVVF